jgi:hypothetical protein
MKLSSSLQRRLHWFNLPTALLLTFLQRTPVVRIATAVEEMVVSSPVSTVLKSVATAVASLGALHSLAGATTLIPSSGSASGTSVAVGTAVTIVYGVNGTQTAPMSWTIGGSVPPGLNFSGLTGPGTVDTGNLQLSGTPTTAGVYSVQITVWEFAGGGGNSQVFSYSLTVTGGAATAPSITTQPQSQTVGVGGIATFTVGASGSPAPTFQWNKSGAPINGATSGTLTLNNVQVGDAATYTAVATNSAGTTTSSGAVLTVSTATAPVITTQPVSQSVTAGGTATFTFTVTGNPAPAIQWKKGATNITGANGATLSLNNVQATDAATYTAVATNSAGTATTNGAVLTVTASTLPVITLQPQGHTVATGSSVVFGVGVSGGGLAYQWKKGGVAISGATSIQYLLSNAQGSDAGSYTVTATNGSGSVTSNAAVLGVVASGDPGRLINASVRIVSGLVNDTLFVGFVVGGAGTSGSKQLLIRGIGPTLTNFGVPGAMVDPILEIYPQGVTVPSLSNDNWAGDATVLAVGNAVGAFALPSGTSKDAALVTTLAGGVYSAKVFGANATTGTVLAEVYDANPAVYSSTTPRLINLSARVPMANDNPLIAGFVIGGSTAKTVMVRAIGPFLAQFFGAAAMADPQLDLYSSASSTVPLLTNDNWGGSALITSTGSSVGAFALTDLASKDAVILVTLDPGVYSAKVTGVNNASGITLVEIYEIP